MYSALRESLGKKGLIGVVLIAILYIALVTYALNYRLFFFTVFGNYPLNYKFDLLSSLLFGSFTALSRLDFYLLLISSILVGFNFVLLFLTVKNLKESLQVGFVIGGASVISVAAVGCTSCGLNLLSILGFSAALAFLPFDGLTIHLISLALLVFSSIYMVRKLEQSCKVPTKK